MNAAPRVLAAILAASIASAATAATVDVSFSNITNNGNADLSSQLQMTVSDVSGQPNKVDFLFKNFVGTVSSVKSIYFDAGAAGSMFTTGSIISQAGASFSWTSPGVLPGSAALQPAFDATLNLVSDPAGTSASTGLNASSDSLVVRMTLAAGKSYDDIFNSLAANPVSADSLRVGLHVRAIGAGAGSDSYVSNMLIVPLPPAAWAGLGCLGLVAGVRFARARRLGA